MVVVARRFEMPLDRAMWATTILFLVIVLGASGGACWAILHDGPEGPLATGVGIAFPLLALSLVPITWALAPRALTLGGGLLRVERPLRAVEVPLAAVRAVGRLPREALRGLVRVGGNGGAFGAYGGFWSRRLGSVRIYATRRRDHVLVDTDGARFLFTPGEPDAFVAALLAAAPQARPLGELVPARGGKPWKVLVAVLLAVPLIVGAGLAAAWAWSPTKVRLEGETVVVERAWAEPVVIPVEVGAARRLEPGELGGLRRVSGTALGGVRYGRFRSGALGSFQLYAPRWGPAFLLQTPQGRVVVVPDDPAAFEEAIAAQAR
jgi:hypothetical protein